MIDKTKVMQYICGRQLFNNDNVRGRYIFFVEHLHDLIRSGKVKRLESPLSVHWTITSQCNLKCKHCYAFKNRNQSDLNLNQCLHILDILSEYNCFDIVFEGGEPFCRSDFQNILSNAKEKKFVVDILTNGTLFTPQTVSFLKNTLDTEIDRIQISLDGAKNENDFIRGEGVYYKVLDGLKLLSGFQNITINTVVTDNNIDSLDKMCQDILSICDVAFIHFSPLINVDRSIGRLSSPEIEHGMDVFIHLKEKYGIKISGSILPDRLFFEQYGEYIPEQYKNNMILGCCAGRSKIYLNPDGSISPCAFINDQSSKFDLSIENFLDTVWPVAWKDLVEKNYSLSRKYAGSKCYYNFCPNFGGNISEKRRV